MQTRATQTRLGLLACGAKLGWAGCRGGRGWATGPGWACDHFSTRTPLMPVTLGTFETRRHDTRPKVTTVLRIATRTCGDTPATHVKALRRQFCVSRLGPVATHPRHTRERFANALQTLATRGFRISGSGSGEAPFCTSKCDNVLGF